MKYLAYIIGALSAATANATVLYKYVPESLTVYINVEESVSYTRDTIEKPVSIDSGYLNLPFTKTYASRTEMQPYRFNAQSLPAGRIVEVVGKKTSMNVTTQISDTGSVSYTMNAPFTDPNDRKTETLGTLIYPETPGQLQEVRVQCPVIDYVKGGRGLTWYWTTMNMDLRPDTSIEGGPYLLASYATCKYQFRVVPEIELTFKNDNMTITGVSGDSLIQSNQVIVKGYGGDGVRARISIANPNPNDIGVSFSATDFNQTTQTAIPTDQGTPYDFYVKVNNTDPGSREYRVNFTAQFD